MLGPRAVGQSSTLTTVIDYFVIFIVCLCFSEPCCLHLWRVLSITHPSICVTGQGDRDRACGESVPDSGLVLQETTCALLHLLTSLDWSQLWLLLGGSETIRNSRRNRKERGRRDWRMTWGIGESPSCVSYMFPLLSVVWMWDVPDRHMCLKLGLQLVHCLGKLGEVKACGRKSVTGGRLCDSTVPPLPLHTLLPSCTYNMTPPMPSPLWWTVSRDEPLDKTARDVTNKLSEHSYYGKHTIIVFRVFQYYLQALFYCCS